MDRLRGGFVGKRLYGSKERNYYECFVCGRHNDCGSKRRNGRRSENSETSDE